MYDEAIDAVLRAAFATPAPSPDPAFVRRLERAVRADQALRRARVGAWRQFRTEVLSLAAIALVLASLWRAGALSAGVAAPVAAAGAMVVIGLAAMLRPLLLEE